MNGRRLTLTLCLVLLAPAPAALAEQEGQAPVLEGESLERNLEDIARSLREIVAFQKIDLLIRRIDLEERRLYPLGQELRGARGDVEGRAEEIVRLSRLEESVREQMARAIRGGADPQQLPQRVEVDQIETAIEVETEQLELAESKVVGLESDLLHGRAKIDELEERLEELLAESER